MSPGLKFKGKNGVSTGVYLVISKEGGVEEGGVERGVTQYHTQGIYLTVISTSILCFTESEFFGWTMSGAYRVDSSATSPFATSIVKFVCCQRKTAPPPPPPRRKGLGGGGHGRHKTSPRYAVD